jgi:hypothetical protein
MPGRPLRWLMALCAALVLAAPAGAQPPRSVSFTWQLIEAWKDPQPGATPAPEALVRELQKTFRFKQYSLLGTHSGLTRVGSAWSDSIGDVKLDATPVAASASTITVDVRLTRGGASVVTSKVSLSPGGQVAVGGATPGGGLIVLLTAR